MPALAYATSAMRNFRLCLVRRSGEVRIETSLSVDDGKQIWSELRSLANRFGESGDFLQVFDESAEMVIRVGVDTARSVKAPTPIPA